MEEVMSVAVEAIFFLRPDICSVGFFMEGLFAHFFSPYRRGYQPKDVQLFLQLANNKKYLRHNFLENTQKNKQPDIRTEVGNLLNILQRHTM